MIIFQFMAVVIVFFLIRTPCVDEEESSARQLYPDDPRFCLHIAMQNWPANFCIKAGSIEFKTFFILSISLNAVLLGILLWFKLVEAEFFYFTAHYTLFLIFLHILFRNRKRTAAIRLMGYEAGYLVIGISHICLYFLYN